MRNFILISYPLRLVALALLLSFTTVRAAVIDTSVPLTSADIVNGITMQGTVNYTGSNDQHGVVYGYGDCNYGQPNLMLKAVWAVIRVCFGNSVLYYEPRWQKGVDLVVKLLVPSDVITGGELQLFINDVLQTPSGYLRTIAEGTAGAVNPNIFGGTFTFDAVTYPTGSSFSVTNVSVYTPESQADTTPPVITVLGSNPTEIIVSSIPTYTDSGATALDDIDGNITSAIIVSGDTVSTTAIGTYTITYTVQDSAGNSSTVNRTVNVIAAPEEPPAEEGGVRGTIRYSKIIGDDEIAPVTVVNEDDQFKLVVKATNVPQPLGNLFFLFAEDNNGSAEMDVNGGGTEETFSIAADASDDLIVNNLLFYAFSSSIKLDKFLSLNNELANGILIEVKSENEVFQFLPIKTTTDFNSKFANGSGRSFDLVFASGSDSLVARFGLTNPFILKKSGTYGAPANDDYIRVIVRDNLSSITKLKFISSGAKE